MMFLVSILILCFHAFSQELYVADLKKQVQDLQNVPCWSEDGDFNEVVCSKETFSCKLEANAATTKRVGISVFLPTDFINSNGGMNGHASVSVYVEKYSLRSVQEKFKLANLVKFQNQEYPVGSRASIYQASRNNNISTIRILKQFYVPENGVVEGLESAKADRKLKIKLPPVSADERYRIDIFSTKIEMNPGDNEHEFFFTPGQYSISVTKISGVLIQSINFSLKVETKEELEGFKELPIKKEHFKKVETTDIGNAKLTFDIDEANKSLLPQLKLTHSESDKEQIFLKSLSEVEIHEQKLDVTKYFKVHSGKGIIKPEKESEFVNLFNKLPVSKLKVIGECLRASKKASSAQMAIYSKADAKSQKLGVILVELSGENGILSKFINQKSEESRFHVNLMEGSCRNESSPELLHVVREIKKDWVNLGKGPWGDNGWTKAPTTSIGNYGEYFSFGNLNWVTITPTKDGKVRITGKDSTRSETEINEPGDESPETRVEFEIHSSKLWNNEGQFMAHPECSYGC